MQAQGSSLTARWLGQHGLGGWCTVWVFPRTPTPSRKASGIAQKRLSLKNSFSLPFRRQSREAVTENWLQRDPNWQPELPLVYCEQEVITQWFRASPFTAGTQRAHGLPGGSMVKICPQRRRARFNSWVRKIPRRRKRQPTPTFSPGQRSLGGLQSLGSQKRWIRLNDRTCKPEGRELPNHF